MAEQPDADHQRPPGLDDATVAAVGKLTESFELVVRARGSLYDFHHLIGRADQLLVEAIERLEAAGHTELAADLRCGYLGRNVVRGRWTFELVEDFDATFYEVAERWTRRVEERLVAGRRHVTEAELKAERRVDGPTDDR